MTQDYKRVKIIKANKIIFDKNSTGWQWKLMQRNYKIIFDKIGLTSEL